MLTDHEKALIRRGLRGLAQQVNGYRERREQLRMIGVIVKAIAAGCTEHSHEGDNLAVIEAPPGTGKSFGLALAAIVMGHTRAKRVVMSTSTVALMEQLLLKDLPVLARALPVPFKAAAAKGRSRYACIAKLARATESESNIARIDGGHRVLRDLARQFDAGAWNGDRDTLSESVDDELWRSITNDAVGCAGNGCPHHGMCPYVLARSEAEKADVVVTNHDYVAAALLSGDPHALPPIEDSVLVFDESHALARKVVAAQTEEVGLLRTADAIASMPDLVRRVVKGLRLSSDPATEADAQVQALAQALRAVHAAAARLLPSGRSHHRLRPGALPAGIAHALAPVRAAADALVNTLLDLRSHVADYAAHESDAAMQVLGWLSPPIRQLHALTHVCALIEDERDAAAEPPARWIGADPAGRDVRLCAAPLRAAEALRKALWGRAAAVAATSATLVACGSFELFLRETGLDAFPRTRLVILPSPYRHHEESTLLVPRMQSDPRNAVAHTAEVSTMLPELIHCDGTLVLFASATQMRAVHAALPPALRAETLMQGDASKSALLARHRARIASGQRSVIFGLASFYEGLDLPGRLCEHVVLAKLPFQVPATPWEESRVEAMRAQGRSHFNEVAVPEVGVRLTQAVGRLVRSENDRGLVTILDRRIADTGWGKRLLSGLPPMRREILPVDWRAVVASHHQLLRRAA